MPSYCSRVHPAVWSLAQGLVGTTTSHAAFHGESGVPHAQVLLDERQDSYAARIHRAPSNHPAATEAKTPVTKRGNTTLQSLMTNHIPHQSARRRAWWVHHGTGTYAARDIQWSDRLGLS